VTSLTRRVAGARARFADLFRTAFSSPSGSKGAEVGGILDDYLSRLEKVDRGYPTPHADTHRPSSGSDPLAIGTPTDIGTANSKGTSDDFARGNHSHRLGIETTKGDLIAHNGADPVRLAVGATTGDALIVDPTQATGMKWGTPLAAEDAMWLAMIGA
jgi:hypothetical protein